MGRPFENFAFNHCISNDQAHRQVRGFVHHLSSAPGCEVSHEHFDHGLDQTHSMLPCEIVCLWVFDAVGGTQLVHLVAIGNSSTASDEAAPIVIALLNAAISRLE